MAVVYGRVLYNYAASHYDELTIRFNQIVTVVSENTGADGWWEVQLQGKKGKVPANYIEVIPEPRGKRAQCMYDHTFEEITGQYLPFKRGDVITVISEDPDGWWLGYADEQQGLFPQEYVQVLSDEITAPVRSEVATVSSTSEPTTPRTNDASDDDDDEDINPLHEALGEVLHDRDMSIIETLCVILDPASSEKMANVVVPIFEHEGKIMDLCQATIDQEIKRTTKASTLFRTNSFASQVMRCYARLCGKDYLTNMLEPLIKQLNDMDGSVEIDPRKLNEDPKYKNLDENLANLKRMCQLFVDAIVNSLKKVPVALNYVSAALVEGVEFKFPEAVRVVIAGFFFLRFLCPAIVSPEGYDIIPKGFLNARGRRGLVLVSKVVQNMANSVEFGNKEEFMKPMNEFVVANFSKINYVLDELPNIPDAGDIEALPRMPVKELTKNYQQLHEILSDNLDKIRKQFEEAGRDMEVFQDLALAVRQLGPTSAQVRQMEVKHKELMVEDDEKRRQKKKADKEEEKKRREEEKKKKEEDRKKKEEEKEKKKGDKKAEKSAKKAKEEEENSVLMPPADAKIMCEGYLSKQTSAAIGKRWKKKYFVLYSGQPRIHYYDSQSVAGNLSPLAGIFCLLPSFFVQTLTKTKHHPGFPFLIKTTSDEYQLVAHTEGELRMWVTTLNRTLNNIATPPTPADAAILKGAFDRKIQMQETEVDAVQAAYQAAKDDDTRTKCLARAELLQTSISACRLARQKLSKASGGSARDDDSSSSASSSSSSSAAAAAATSSTSSSGLTASTGSHSTTSGSVPSLTSSAPAATSGASGSSATAAKTKPPVMRTKPPVVRPGGAVAASPAAASPSMPAALPSVGGGRAGGMPAGGGRAAAGAMPGAAAMMGQLPPGMTMQQYQMYQQQQQQLRYQQQLQYQQQMAARAQNPYGWQ